MKPIEVNIQADDKARLVAKIKDYFESELDHDIGGFEAEFLIDFLAQEVGPYLYNQGLSDAHTLLNEKVEELGYQIQELEKPLV
jgi:uncharacterized protein (DUF2164 family)